MSTTLNLSEIQHLSARWVELIRTEYAERNRAPHRRRLLGIVQGIHAKIDEKLIDNESSVVGPGLRDAVLDLDVLMQSIPARTVGRDGRMMGWERLARGAAERLRREVVTCR